jgi:hypothetical protein
MGLGFAEINRAGHTGRLGAADELVKLVELRQGSQARTFMFDGRAAALAAVRRGAPSTSWKPLVSDVSRLSMAREARRLRRPKAIDSLETSEVSCFHEVDSLACDGERRGGCAAKSLAPSAGPEVEEFVRYHGNTDTRVTAFPNRQTMSRSMV